jgi:S1-C subfamily serine protease
MPQFRWDRAPIAQVDRTQMLGIECSPLPDVMKEQLDIEAGLVVESVVEDTLAKKLGLRRHDVLIELNGKLIEDVSAVRDTLRDVKQGATVKAVVLRKGKRETFEAIR